MLPGNFEHIVQAILNLYQNSNTKKHALLLIPVFKAGTVSRTVSERRANFIGTIFVPIDISSFLEGAKDEANTFDYFGITIGDDETISGTTIINSKRTITDLRKQNIRLLNKTMVLDYNDYSIKKRASNIGRQTTLYSGIGLAIMIYLVLMIMQLGEKRANLASLNAEREIYQSEAKYQPRQYEYEYQRTHQLGIGGKSNTAW